MVSPYVDTTENKAGAQERSRTLGRVRALSFLAIIRVLSYIPFGVRSSIGWALGYLAGLLPLKEQRFAQLQLRSFLPECSARTTTPQVFANAGRTLLESLSLQPMLRRHTSRIQCDAWPTIETWVRDERPIVCLTGHTGNWDLLAAYVISRGIPLTTIGREARSPTAQKVLETIREGYGIETIWRSDRTGLKRLLQCLKERRVVAALIDQDTRVDSIMVPFFGTPAKTPVSLISLGRKMNARFVTAFLFRTGWFRYTVWVEEIPDLNSEYDILCEYHQRLETLIRRFPSQWVWFHKRWRSLPDGTTLSSREYQALLHDRLAQHKT